MAEFEIICQTRELHLHLSHMDMDLGEYSSLIISWIKNLSEIKGKLISLNNMHLLYVSERPLPLLK